MIIPTTIPQWQMISFSECLLIMLAHKLIAACIELETAFLYGVLSLKIYLKITEEYDLEHEMAEDDCLLQRHSIDRLIQVHMV